MLISLTAASSCVASFCSTILFTIPISLRIIRPYPNGLSVRAVKTVATAPFCLWYSNNSAKVCAVNNGVSPHAINVMPSLAPKSSSACKTAWPVPSCSACNAYSVRSPKVCSTASEPWPTIVTISSILFASIWVKTWSTIGRPQTGCKTLYNLDFIRVPWPAAKIIAYFAVIFFSLSSSNIN